MSEAGYRPVQQGRSIGILVQIYLDEVSPDIILSAGMTRVEIEESASAKEFSTAGRV
jgi:hypothetical protein